MDTLHQINPQEQPIARGEYNYQVSGKDSGLTESWSLHQVPETALIHRAEVSGSVASIRLKQVSHFVMTTDFRPSLLEMTQDIDGQQTRTVIQCYGEKIEQLIFSEDQTDKTVHDVPAGYCLFFPPVSAQGFITRRYDMNNSGQQALSLASIRMQPEDALSLSIELQTIDFEHRDSDEEIETPAGQFTCYHFIRYDQHMEQQLWLDKRWTVIQWSVPYSPIMKWEYLLTRYYWES